MDEEGHHAEGGAGGALSIYELEQISSERDGEWLDGTADGRPTQIHERDKPASLRGPRRKMA